LAAIGSGHKFDAETLRTRSERGRNEFDAETQRIRSEKRNKRIEDAAILFFELSGISLRLCVSASI
jgi:hypothetical protein